MFSFKVGLHKFNAKMANVKIEPRIYIYILAVFMWIEGRHFFVYGKVAAKNIFIHHHYEDIKDDTTCRKWGGLG